LCRRFNARVRTAKRLFVLWRLVIASGFFIENLKITYPSSTGSSATYGYEPGGNLTMLTAGSAITSGWTYNADDEVATTTINGLASGTVAYIVIRSRLRRTSAP
jgi:hypothetical protein